MLRTPAGDLPERTRLGEVLWLEPYPDLLLQGLADAALGPDARYEAREAISLTFLTALQLLPPRQRAVLILRDVLGFHASEVAQILESTKESVTSALKRARATLQRQLVRPGDREPAPTPDSAAERKLLERFTRVFEAGDAASIVAMLTEDVLFTMPPFPVRVARTQAGGRIPQTDLDLAGLPGPGWSRPGLTVSPRSVLYPQHPQTSAHHALGLLVLTLAGSRGSAITRFDAGVLPRFGLHQALVG